jgi:RIO-like serine/threonine protein kinase
MFTKHFQSESEEDVRREARLQTIAHEFVSTPRILDCQPTSITMERVDGMTVADMYGADIRRVPHALKREMYEMIHTLYKKAGIQYIDVTGYNFVIDENTGQLWIIDFGHAREQLVPLNPYLERLFKMERLTRWNSIFK